MEFDDGMEPPPLTWAQLRALYPQRATDRDIQLEVRTHPLGPPHWTLEATDTADEVRTIEFHCSSDDGWTAPLQGLQKGVILMWMNAKYHYFPGGQQGACIKKEDLGGFLVLGDNERVDIPAGFGRGGGGGGGGGDGGGRTKAAAQESAPRPVPAGRRVAAAPAARGGAPRSVPAGRQMAAVAGSEWEFPVGWVVPALLLLCGVLALLWSGPSSAAAGGMR